MDQEIWSKLVNEARDAEIELRKVSFDTMRPAIPVATYNRLVANAYGRIMALEARLDALVGGKLNTKPAATELRGPIVGAYQPAPSQSKG